MNEMKGIRLLCLIAAGTIAQAADTGPPVAEVELLVSAVEREADVSAGFFNAYVGTEACLACHKEYAEFRWTLHATGLKTAADDRHSMMAKTGVIADYDQNAVDDFKQGLDFNNIKSPFDAFKPNAPVLGYGPNGYTIRIGTVVYDVVMVHGGSGLYKQRYLVRLPTLDTDSGKSAGVYYSPLQYNERTRAWVTYETKYWYAADNTPLINGPMSAKEAAGGKSFIKGCAGCHATTLTTVGKDANGEYVATTPTPVYVRPDSVHYLDLSGKGQPELYNVGCERCHGPGARHIMATWAPGRIPNPARDFTAKQQNFQCGSCHVRGASLPSGTHEYPYDEDAKQQFAAYAPTEELFTRFLADKPGLWPDGKTSRQHHQQLQDLMKSSKWEYENHKVTCTECHDPHRPTKSQLRQTMVVDGAGGAKITVPVKVNDNSLCLACHAGFGPFQALQREQILDMQTNQDVIAQVVTAHTHHPYNPEETSGVSRCTSCHMAAMASSGAAYDIHSHTFEAVPPERTLKYQEQGGMPNSCATCHRQMAALSGTPEDTSLTTWNEPSDVALAQWLMKYFGPEGTWWRTKSDNPK